MSDEAAEPTELAKYQQRVAALESELAQVRSHLETLQQKSACSCKSESRYRQIFENAPISMLLLNTDGYITQMNAAAEDFYGLTIDQFNEQACPIYDNAQLIENGTLPYMLRAFAGKSVIEAPTFYDTSRDYQNGKLTCGQGHYAPIRNEAGAVEEIVEIAADVNAFFALQTQLLQEKDFAAQERARLLTTIAQVANLLLRSPDYASVFPEVVRLLGEAVGSDRCAIKQEFIEPQSNKPAVKLLTEWCQAEIPSVLIGSPEFQNGIIRENPGLLLQQLLQGETVNFVVAELQEPEWRSLFEAHENRSMLIVPIMVQGNCWGHIGFDNCREPQRYDEAEIAILKIAADSIAAAIERQVKDHELRKVQESLLQAEQDRVAELAKTNQALKNSLDRLAADPDLNSFLGYVLLEITHQLNLDVANLRLYDAATETLSLELQIREGRVLLKHQIQAPEAMLHPSTQSTPVWRILRQTKQPFVVNRENAKEYCFQDTYEHQADELGLQVAVNLLLTLGDEPIGLLDLGSTQRTTLTSEDLELAQALTQQATLAIQLTRLAEEVKETAIARQQEQAALERSIQLARANTALQKTLDVLATEPDLNHSLGHVLQVTTEHLGSTSAAFWLTNPDNETSSLHLVYLDGRIIPATPEYTDQLSGQWIRGRDDLSRDLNWKTHLHERAPVVYDVADCPEIMPPQRQFLQRLGVQTLLGIPLLLGAEIVGTFTVRFTERRKFSAEELELTQAIAHQATLVIRLTRLAEAAKQTAIARQQEQAAQERVAELAKTNCALKNSLDTLANNPDIDSFIGQLLNAIATQFNSPIVEYWYHDSNLSAYLGMMCRQQQIYTRSQLVNLLPHHPGIAGCHIPKTLFNEESLFQQDQPFHIPNLATSVLADSTRWYEQQGIQQLLNLPMTLGNELIGAIAIYLHANQPFTTEDQEFAQALTHQATLAVQLTRLAEEAKQFALIQERAFTAREIHDTLAQHFGGILMQLQAVDRLYTLKPDKAQEHITHTRNLARQGLAEARSSIWVLSQEGEAYSNLLEVLQQLVAQMAIGSETQTTMTITGEPYSLSPTQGINLLRIAQESLNNALRHANARTILLRLDYAPHQLCLQIIDDGVGFTLPSRGTGFGLRGMQQRADSLGAQFNVRSAPGEGTTITVMLPIAQNRST